MIEIKTHLGTARIVEHHSELPDFSGASVQYKDIESKNGMKGGGGTNAWQGDRVCGVAVTVDDREGAWYVPYRHTDPLTENLPIEKVLPWLEEHNRIPVWVNHNIKFDQAFLYHDSPKLEFPGQMIDTVVMAKMVNSDRWSHDLKPLCREWLKLPMEEELKVKNYLVEVGKHKKIIKANWSYSDVPADILGEYACIDVLANRELYKYLKNELPEDSKKCWETEVKLTPVLWDMERDGLRVDPEEVKDEITKANTHMFYMENALVNATKQEYVDSAKHLYDLLCLQEGLPVLGRTEKGSPSFKTEVLEKYPNLPDLTDRQKALIDLIVMYRAERHFKSLFLESYSALQDSNNRIHASYNQLVRTGRMSGKRPNMQQLNKRAKSLIKPDEGCWFGDWDASQIEFRIIIHYIKDAATIAQYKIDPYTDAHNWMAGLCRSDRRIAKTMNFLIAYSGGRKLAIEKLSPFLSVSGANEVFDIFHDTLPGVKIVTDNASRICKRRGYVYTAFGRRRYLPPKASHKAFNTVVQGTAMDYIKTRMVALSPRYNDKLKGWGITQRVNVHDSLVFNGDCIHHPEVRAHIDSVLPVQEVDFRVPFVWDSGFSDKDWASVGPL